MRSAVIPLLLTPSGRAQEAVRSIDDWTSVIDDATAHGVVPLLHNALASVDLPTDVSHRIRDVYLHSMLRAQAIKDDAAAVVRTLGDAGIQPLALKGLHLAFGLYEEPGVRPMNDIDLLVRRDQLNAASEVLRTVGYGVSSAIGADMDYDDLHHVRPVLKMGSVPVELHHALEPRDAPYSTDLGGVWHRSSTITVHGVDLLAMALDDLLLHLCTHAAYNHRFDIGLLALFDIATVLRHPNLDWIRFVETANTDGRSRYAFTALHVVAQFWPDIVPLDRVENLFHESDDVHITATAADQVANLPLDVPVGLRAARTAGSVGATIRSVLSSVVPPPHRMREIYGLEPDSPMVWWKYLSRPFDLTWRRGRDAAAIVLRTERGRSLLDQEERVRRISAWADRGSGAFSQSANARNARPR